MPTIDDLKLEIRDSSTRDKLYAVEAVEVDSEPHMLLQYLKNEYTQKQILDSLEDFIDHSVAFEDAQESVDHLHQIVLDIEDKVDLEDPQESMQRIDLFEPEEDIAKYIPLGLNAEYDIDVQFSPRDLVMVGGKRGAGKSVICANIANNVYASGKSAIYFTIEMDSRNILQRCCSIATNVPFSRLRTKNLSVGEWERVAEWWSNRFVLGQDRLNEYKQHRDFEKFHANLKTGELLPTNQLLVEYDPSLTLSKIRAVLDKKVKPLNVGIIIVDYINQVKRSSLPGRGGQYDWTEQIEVSKALKSMAQEYDCTVMSPYQTDATGEARFAKGILDACDAAYTLETWDHEDACITLNCVKMRNGAMNSFSSTVDWDTLKIGPESALTPQEKDDSSHKTGEDINDI
jgi:replicative DNA helicase|tara:strand:+ start:176 stop:1378 length:1203 start_codon:yes stop_codon:yes gene_type:complete